MISTQLLLRQSRLDFDGTQFYCGQAPEKRLFPPFGTMVRQRLRGIVRYPTRAFEPWKGFVWTIDLVSMAILMMLART
jgi:hypothetical protein